MSKLVMGLGVALILMGLWVVVVPDQLVSIVDWESRQGLYLAAGLRVVIGLMLVLSASSTRYPKGLLIVGGLVLLAGLGLPFFPIDLWAGPIRWLLVENLVVYRVAGGVGGMLLGAFFVHAALPERSR